MYDSDGLKSRTSLEPSKIFYILVNVRNVLKIAINFDFMNAKFGRLCCWICVFLWKLMSLNITETTKLKSNTLYIFMSSHIFNTNIILFKQQSYLTRIIDCMIENVW